MKKRGNRKERGQASIVIGMFILTFMLFFAFVVNTGMLINAKINLQNAADLAAYAGAATQARQMTELSFINYEMRRQYKKFLFRYYILGTMFQDSFPGAKPGQGFSSGGRVYNPGYLKVGAAPLSAAPYPFPAVCVDLYSAPSGATPGTFGGQEAYCHFYELPSIAGAGQNAASVQGDAIQATLDQELNSIEKVREAACDNLSAINQTLLYFWLFNTLPEGPNIQSIAGTGANSGFNQTSVQIMFDRVTYLSGGLGLIPRELLLAFRAGVLQGWINQPPTTLTGSAVDSWRNGPDAMMHERSINAFKSAYDTLGDTTWDPASISLEELLPQPSGTPMQDPPGNPQVNLLGLNRIDINFTVWSVGYEPPAGTSPTATTKPCDQRLYPIPVVNLPVGFYKTPDFSTYYAVRLRANAQVLFAPWKTPLTLTAYSAAMPFGSRIGPQLGQNDFTYQTSGFMTLGGYQPSQNSIAFALNSIPLAIPNLPVQKNDTAGSDSGWNLNEIQNAYYQWVPQYGNRQEYDALLNLAMAPTPYEESRYDIPNDLPLNGVTDSFIQWFDKNAEMALWAPITNGTPGQFQTSIQNALQAFFQNGAANVSTGTVSGGAPTFPTPAALQTTITQSMLEYAQRLINNSNTEGVNNATTPPPGAVFEGIYTMPMANPFVVPPGIYNTIDGQSGALVTKGAISPPNPIETTGIGSILIPKGTNTNLFYVDPNTPKDVASVRDSWNAVQDSKFVPAGRVGYSVKFVSFKELMGFSNPLSGSDQDLSDVLPKIQH